MSVLEARNLYKKFGGFVAVDNVSLSLKEGEILGLLGPNGAGKTTVIQMLLGVLTPTSGEVVYFGKSFNTSRESALERVNFSSTYTNLPWNLSVYECLTFVSYLYTIRNRKKRVQEMCSMFKLEDLVKKQMQDLSAGQLTRVNLAKAFINHPKVLLLDEPTASLDPDVADYIRQFLLSERKRFKVSILLTSHNMSEVEEVCDRVIFINDGKIIADDTPEGLARTIDVCHIELRILEGLEAAIQYADLHAIPHRTDGKYTQFDLRESVIPTFLSDLMAQGVKYAEISIDKPTLQDYFLQVALAHKNKQ